MSGHQSAPLPHGFSTIVMKALEAHQHGCTRVTCITNTEIIMTNHVYLAKCTMQLSQVPYIKLTTRILSRAELPELPHLVSPAAKRQRSEINAVLVLAKLQSGKCESDAPAAEFASMKSSLNRQRVKGVKLGLVVDAASKAHPGRSVRTALR